MQPDFDIVALCRSHLEELPGIRKVTIRTPVRFIELPSADLSLVLETDVGQFTYFGAVKRRLTPSKLDHWLLPGGSALTSLESWFCRNSRASSPSMRMIATAAKSLTIADSVAA